MSNKYYITTAIPYVNAKPHIGHALEFVQTDALARYRRVRGEDVCLLSGGDENALKNVQAAEAVGIPVQEFIDVNAELFRDLAQKLNVRFDVFQKGSDHERHYSSSQKLWGLCDAAGDIYKKIYEGLYCVGCETFYDPDELNEKGECVEHPGKKLEKVSEENYFFRLSKYQNNLIELIERDTLKIIPQTRKNEVLSFLKQPLRDISISRTNARAKNWGVPVPGDDAQRIYVWLDALNIYQSGVGFGWDKELYKKWWPADLHVIGKGIIRFHAVYWPAFLLSAKLPLPKSIFVHGYITVDGQKMSKSVGNVIDPLELIEKYGVDPVRYYFLREVPSYEDGDFSYEKFEARYNGDLANGLGNLIARVVTLAAKLKNQSETGKIAIKNSKLTTELKSVKVSYKKAIEEIKLNEALEEIWKLIHAADRFINDEKPWEQEKPEVITDILLLILEIASLLEPFLPETTDKIREQIKIEGPEIIVKKGASLFPRL
jgi:methionyl-tRNA synthetase